MKSQIIPESTTDLKEDIIQLIFSIKLAVFDFDGVFTDNSVYVDENGRETVRCSRAEGFGLKKLKALGIKSFVLSTEKNQVVSKRCEKLEIPCQQSCDNKLEDLKVILNRFDVSPKEALFVGNDINDLACLQYIGLPIVVSDAYQEVKDISRLITKKLGGYGAVREVCDLIYEVRTNVG